MHADAATLCTLGLIDQAAPAAVGYTVAYVPSQQALRSFAINSISARRALRKTREISPGFGIASR